MDETVPNLAPPGAGDARPVDSSSSAVSVQKLLANRANAQRSTGARTAAGKAVSCLNGRRHGILAEADILGPRASREDADAFAARLEALRAHFQPKGAYEEGLVAQLVHTEWQERQAVRHATAVVERQLEEARASAERAHTVAVACAMRYAGERRAEALRATSAGIEYLIRVLQDLQCTAEREGGLTEHGLRELVEHLGETAPLVQLVRAWRAPEHPAPGVSGDGGPAAEATRADAVRAFQQAIRELRRRKRAAERQEAQNLERTLRCLELPAEAHLTLILRYRADIDRRRARILLELERAQRLRGGEHVPPPLSVHVEGPE